MDQASAVPVLHQQFEGHLPLSRLQKTRATWSDLLKHHVTTSKKTVYAVHLKTNQQDNPPCTKDSGFSRITAKISITHGGSGSLRLIPPSPHVLLLQMVYQHRHQEGTTWVSPSWQLSSALRVAEIWFACLFAPSLQLETEVELKNICIPVQSHHKSL